MSFPKDLIDLSQIDDLSIGGRGGKESIIGQLLPNWERVNHALYDYKITHNGIPVRLEVKKQQDLQWFDSGKYYKLNEADKDIYLMFIMHNGGVICRILVTKLGKFIDWLCEHRKEDGWAEEVMEVAAHFKDKYPTLQFKARAQIAKIAKEAPALFEVIWEKGSA